MKLRRQSDREETKSTNQSGQRAWWADFKVIGVAATQ